MNKSSIPNVFTFINLSLGIISILLCFNNKTGAASFCILLAALLDRYDGKVARKLGVACILGKELDSLSDLVSFGVAPAILAWKLSLVDFGIISYFLVLVFPICGAYRLARFNVTEFNNVYMGVPITIAGALMGLDALVSIRTGAHPGFTAIFMLLLSYLMVSSIKIKKF